MVKILKYKKKHIQLDARRSRITADKYLKQNVRTKLHLGTLQLLQAWPAGPGAGLSWSGYKSTRITQMSHLDASHCLWVWSTTGGT